METNISNIMNSLVPISRFNKGEANKIFEELKDTGFKVVLKNNTPACVLLTPEAYEEMMETIEDYKLYIEAEKRIRASKDDDYISSKDLLKELGIDEDELSVDDVELG